MRVRQAFMIAVMVVVGIGANVEAQAPRNCPSTYQWDGRKCTYTGIEVGTKPAAPLCPSPYVYSENLKKCVYPNQHGAGPGSRIVQ